MTHFHFSTLFLVCSIVSSNQPQTVLITDVFNSLASILQVSFVNSFLSKHNSSRSLLSSSIKCKEFGFYTPFLLIILGLLLLFSLFKCKSGNWRNMTRELYSPLHSFKETFSVTWYQTFHILPTLLAFERVNTARLLSTAWNEGIHCLRLKNQMF